MHGRPEDRWQWCLLCFVIILATLFVPYLRLHTPLPEGFDDGKREGLAPPSGVLVVNLDRRLDRMTHFRHGFTWTDMARKVPLHRVSAVEGSSVDASKVLTEEAMKELKDFLQTKTRRKHSQLTPGAIGCYMSHIKCWEYVAHQNRPWIICEDDAILPSDFGSRIEMALREIPATRKETVILFHILCNPKLYHELRCEKIKDNVYRAHHFWSTACYYITPEAAREMLKKALPMSIQVDHAMAQWGREGVVDNFAYPVVRTWESAGTDIQAPIQN